MGTDDSLVMLMSDPEQRQWLPPGQDMAQLVAWIKQLQAALKEKNDAG